MSRKQQPPELSANDKKELARLVGKYGRDIIVAAVRRVHVRSRGRSTSFWERPDLVPPAEWSPMEKAEWIEERVAHYIAAGQPKRGTLQQATLDLYERCFSIERRRVAKDFERFAGQMKKARARLLSAKKAVQRAKDYRRTHPRIRRQPAP